MRTCRLDFWPKTEAIQMSSHHPISAMATKHSRLDGRVTLTGTTSAFQTIMVACLLLCFSANHCCKMSKQFLSIDRTIQGTLLRMAWRCECYLRRVGWSVLRQLLQIIQQGNSLLILGTTKQCKNCNKLIGLHRSRRQQAAY